MSMQAPSNIAQRYDFLQQRGKHRNGASFTERSRPITSKADIENLKEFYLQRLSRSTPQAAAPLNPLLVGRERPGFNGAAGGPAQPRTPGRSQSPRPMLARTGAADIEELEVMCNDCFQMVKVSDAPNCTGDPKSCSVANRLGSREAAGQATGQVAMLDVKLKQLREAIEARFARANDNSRVNIMRHLTQLRYHIDTAIKWTKGCPEIGGLSDHTVQQVKQLTAMSRVLEPAIYIFSKRIENAILQKERELRKVASKTAVGLEERNGSREVAPSEGRFASTLAWNSSFPAGDVSSIAGDLDSECGTNYMETVVTQDGGPGSNDVGNLQEADDYLSLKNEDEQRRWFYSQCLAMKLSSSDQAAARKILISDLYTQVRKEEVPIEQWRQWIRKQIPSLDEPDQRTLPSPANAGRHIRSTATIGGRERSPVGHRSSTPLLNGTAQAGRTTVLAGHRNPSTPLLRR